MKEVHQPSRSVQAMLIPNHALILHSQAKYGLACTRDSLGNTSGAALTVNQLPLEDVQFAPPSDEGLPWAANISGPTDCSWQLKRRKLRPRHR
jgi:hypothetical protein